MPSLVGSLVRAARLMLAVGSSCSPSARPNILEQSGFATRPACRPTVGAGIAEIADSMDTAVIVAAKMVAADMVGNLISLDSASRDYPFLSFFV